MASSIFTLYSSLLSIRAICFTDSVFPVPGAPGNKNLFIPRFRLIAFTIPITSCSIDSGRGRGSLPTTIFSKKPDGSSLICGTKVLARKIFSFCYLIVVNCILVGAKPCGCPFFRTFPRLLQKRCKINFYSFSLLSGRRGIFIQKKEAARNKKETPHPTSLQSEFVQ